MRLQNEAETLPRPGGRVERARRTGASNGRVERARRTGASNGGGYIVFTPQLPASSQLVRTFRYSRIELNQLQLVIRVNSRYTFVDSEASEKDHRKPVLEHDRLLAATVPAKLDAGSIGNDVTTTGIVLASLAGCHSEWGQDRSAKNTFIRPAATFSRPRE